MKNEKLTKKQENACLKYVACLDKSEAYRFAFNAENMKPETINRRAFDLFQVSKVKARVKGLLDERSKKLKVDSDYVLQRLTDIDKMDVLDILKDNGDIKAIKDWPKTWRTTLSGLDIAVLTQGDDEAIMKKIKWPDKVKNLELIGKHVNVKAWDKEKEETSDDSLVTAMTKLIDKLPS